MNARLIQCFIAVIVLVALAAQEVRGQPGTQPSRIAEDPSLEGGRLTADNVAVQDLARIQGQGESVLRGVGIVTGLGKGKGDKGSEMALARPLAAVYEANNIALPDLKDLNNSTTCALVALEVVIPPQGARQDDTFDVRITTLHSASDLTGGQLMIAPLLGPLAGDPTLYAMASGTIMIEDKATPTTGIIQGAARMVTDVAMPAIRDSFVLTVQPQYRHYTVTSRVADAINGMVNDPQEGVVLTDRNIHTDVARALNDTSILITIPPQERGNVPQFVAMVMSTQVTLALLSQPAEVRINPRTGSIVFSGNVEISPVAISHKNLVITTVVPAAQPTAGNPQRIRESMTTIDTSSRSREKAKIQDLLLAFRSLDVPIEDRISIIRQLHKAGRLHARLVIE